MALFCRKPQLYFGGRRGIPTACGGRSTIGVVVAFRLVLSVVGRSKFVFLFILRCVSCVISTKQDFCSKHFYRKHNTCQNIVIFTLEINIELVTKYVRFVIISSYLHFFIFREPVKRFSFVVAYNYCTHIWYRYFQTFLIKYKYLA